MNRFATTFTAAALSALSLAAAGPAAAQGRWDWSPGDRAYRLAGPGVPLLYPELRTSPRGRAFVMRNFDLDRNGFISPREAQAANRAFAEVAGARRDRFDWDRPGHVVVVEQPRGGWDHRAMRNYGFRQTARGATLNLQEDVLFKTDSDVLRPGALDKLRPLAGYLKSEQRDARGHATESPRRGDFARPARRSLQPRRLSGRPGARGQEPRAPGAHR